MARPTNHYGVRVDCDIPVTGVVHNAAAEWLHEEITSGIDLDYEEALHDYETDTDAFFDKYSIPHDEREDFDFDDYGDAFGPSTYLIGAWKQVDGQYEPDKSGEYAAIVGEIYTQVVFSQYVERCALCSLCYPGQGDIGDRGSFLTYTLPLDMWGEGLDQEELEHIRAETVTFILNQFVNVVENWLSRSATIKDVKTALKSSKSLLGRIERAG